MNLSKFIKKIDRFYYEQISSRIFPRQKWLTDVIPRTFRDIDFLIEQTTFACLVSYWENDDGKDMMAYSVSMYDNPSSFLEEGLTMEQIQEKKAEAQKIYDELVAAYNWAKLRSDVIAALDDELVEAYETPRWSEVANNHYIKEQEFIDTDTKHLQTIIKYRKYLWS